MRGPAAAEDLEVVRSFVHSLAERLGPQLLRAALFGSRARGMAWSGSDYDVFLLVDREDAASRHLIYDAAYRYFPLDFNLHIYTPESLEAAATIGSSVLRDVVAEGVPLWPGTAGSLPTG